jgi:uncharacterized protein YjbI with pentapeptide repeats
MANPQHLAQLKKGVAAWNAWRRSRPKVTPDLTGADLTGIALDRADFTESDVEKTIFARATLSGASFARSNVGRANFEHAQLKGANLLRANMRGANLKGANLAQSLLQRSNLTSASLAGADLRLSNSEQAIFLGANLSEADLTSSELFASNFREANLNGANLRRTYLEDADFSKADLRGADFCGAYFSNTQLFDATVGYTVFGNNDLRGLMGLETVVHAAPSVVGVESIFLSGGKIPETFLRGGGLPEEFITYMKSLTANPIEFYSCFISYSTKDQDFADRLYADLQSKGVRCWFAAHDVHGGKKLHEQIDEAIRLHDKLLLILSPHSMESEWVKTEIAKARKRELRDQRRVLFPIRLAPFETLRDWECFDADTGKDSAHEIREYFIPDFSNWRDYDSYQEAFQRLIGNLKASDSETK